MLEIDKELRMVTLEEMKFMLKNGLTTVLSMDWGICCLMVVVVYFSMIILRLCMILKKNILSILRGCQINDLMS